MQLWILASEHDGNVPNDLEEIKFRLRDSHIKQKDINILIDKGFLVGCKQVLADASKCSPEERRGEERQRQTNVHFLAFWNAYPKKIGKQAALKAYQKIPQSKEQLQIILNAIKKQKQSAQWQKDNGQFIPNPATWLNQGRWEDEINTNTQNNGWNVKYIDDVVKERGF